MEKIHSIFCPITTTELLALLLLLLFNAIGAFLLLFFRCRRRKMKRVCVQHFHNYTFVEDLEDDDDDCRTL